MTKVWIASFDIGKVNFAFSIEEVDQDILSNIKTIPKNKRYNSNGTCTLEFQNVLDKVYANGRIVLMNNVNLTNGCIKGKYHDQTVFHNLIDCLNEYKTTYWDNVQYFIVERQMKINFTACRLSVICMSYFMFNYGTFRKVIEFDSYYKTTILGAPKAEKKLKNGNIKYVSTTKPIRKKWAVDAGGALLAKRDEFQVLSDMSKFKKKDDINDTILQSKAFQYLYFVDKVEF